MQMFVCERNSKVETRAYLTHRENVVHSVSCESLKKMRDFDMLIREKDENNSLIVSSQSFLVFVSLWKSLLVIFHHLILPVLHYPSGTSDFYFPWGIN